ncbi:MAG TPA: DUF2461 domain-containing protein [Bacteroidota bacterium]|nr:DUF2461 domain-containing protein [Bacteroidota bacterium]
MKTPPVDFEAYPPFTGFPPEGIRFLRQLKRHNRREWFNAHKTEYEEFVKFPMESLIASLAGPLEKLAPGTFVHPKKSMFRIYRDTRFSKNKDPYKTHVAAIFHPKGPWQDAAGFYLHIEPGRTLLAGGIYMPDGGQLKKIRAAITRDPGAFLGVVRSRSFRKSFGQLEGDKLSRAPLGYSPDDPMIGWLKFKQFIVYNEWPEGAAAKKNFTGLVMSVYGKMLPLVCFLNNALHR